MKGRRSGRKKEIGRPPASLWKRAAAALKDKSSLYVAMVADRKGFRLPDLEVAIIKATSHDEATIDYKNANRVFAWVRTSPAILKPLLWALSRRMEKTRCWVVAIKGLILTHGLLCTKIPALATLRRLPFDLSTFSDRYAHPAQAPALTTFTRSYFAFLDRRSTFLSGAGDLDRDSMPGALLELQRSQALLDLLFQIRPFGNGMDLGLILEAMDCVVIEICDVYSGICHRIAGVLARIHMAAGSDAAAALQILQKAAAQSSRLSSFFIMCRSLGVWNANKFPPVEQIPEDDIRDLQRIIYGGSTSGVLPGYPPETTEEERGQPSAAAAAAADDWRGSPETVVTLNWVVFSDEFQMPEPQGTAHALNPFVNSPREAMVEWEEFSHWHQQQYRSLPILRAALDANQKSLACYM